MLARANEQKENSFLEPEQFSRADWEALFRQLTQDMDPWAIDIVALVRRFREYLAELSALELAIPGRMVVASAVLLRMKSERLSNGQAQGTLSEVVDEVVMASPPEDAYIAFELPLPKVVRRPRAKASVSDLRRALSAVFSRTSRPKTALTPAELGIDLRREPFSRRAARLLRKLLALCNGERVIPFCRISQPDPIDQVARLMELLYLDRRGKIRLFQKEFLAELMIEVKNGAMGHR